MFLLVISVLSNNAQPIYQIPWAQQQPKFVFPIYFEDGTGEKDTLYLGYDSLANGYSINSQPNHDTVFGVNLIKIDTTKFYVFWGGDFYDSLGRLKERVFQANVSRLSAGHFSALISLNNGDLPLKVSWDKSLLYSDSLPFPANNPFPRGQGRFIIDYGPDDKISENGFVMYYPAYYYALVTDTTIFSQCTVRDSLTISNYNNVPQSVASGNLHFSIESWTGLLTDVQIIKNESPEIFPNPFVNYLYYSIPYTDCELRTIIIFDMVGKCQKIFTQHTSNGYIFLDDLRSGYYLVQVSNCNLIYTKKIFKL